MRGRAGARVISFLIDFIRIDQVERGLFLAAPALAGSIGANRANIAPISDHELFAIAIHKQGAMLDGVDGELVGSGEMSTGFEISICEALVGKDAERRVVPFQPDQFPLRGSYRRARDQL